MDLLTSTNTLLTKIHGTTIEETIITLFSLESFQTRIVKSRVIYSMLYNVYIACFGKLSELIVDNLGVRGRKI